MLFLGKPTMVFTKIYGVMIECAIAGIVFAETWISYDEWQFTTEVRREPANMKRRSRCFPFHGCDVLYDEKIGFGAVD